jgi:ankyrin repeat protein
MQEELYSACKNGHAEVVRAALADPRVNPTAQNNEAIRWAALFGHAEVVRALLADPRVNPTAQNNEAIRWAAGNGHAVVVRLFLADPRVNPTAQDNFAIIGAALRGHAEVVRLLLPDPRVNPAADDNKAIKNAKPSCARVFASDARCGIEVNYRLFQKHHPAIAREYDAVIDQCYAMAWLAKQEITWSDMVEPMLKRLKASF